MRIKGAALSQSMFARFALTFQCTLVPALLITASCLQALATCHALISSTAAVAAALDLAVRRASTCAKMEALVQALLIHSQLPASLRRLEAARVLLSSCCAIA